MFYFTSTNKRKNLLRFVIVAFFVAVLMLGICIHKDYGISSDEPIQRQHSLINYSYVDETIFDRNIIKINNLTGTDGKTLPNLENYQHKYYGIAIQLPLVFIEDTADFTMTTQQIYFMRHLYNFLMYYLALICFFFLCKDLFKSEIWALAGTVMLFLYPRFFAESFYNIKDMMFVALLIISMFFMIRMLLDKRKTLWCVLFAVICAFATNTRVIGGMLIAAAVTAMIAEDLTGHFSKNEEIKCILLRNADADTVSLSFPSILRPYIIICLVYVFFYLLITPASWQMPGEFIKNLFITFSDYSSWGGQMLFMGQLISKGQIPWFYIPVWMGISIPMSYLIMFLIGTGVLIYGVVNDKLVKFVEMRHLWIILMLFFVPLFMMIVLKIKIYVGWRHVYFLVPPLLLISVYGAKCLHEKLLIHIKKVGRYIIPGLMCTVFAWLSVWMFFAHPYQNVYFNFIGRAYATEFDRDYWRLASADMFKYLLSEYNGDLNIWSSRNQNVAKNILTPEQQMRIHIVDAPEKASFIVDNFRYTAGNEYTVDGFKEVYSIHVDGFKIGSVLKNKEYNK